MAKKFSGRIILPREVLYSLDRTLEEADNDGARNVHIELNVKNDKVVGGNVVGECTTQWSSNFEDDRGN